MKLEQYEIVIPEGCEAANGYVALAHNTQYTIRLTNHGSRMADVEVFIDGGRVGEWRVNSNSVALLERPVHDTGRFTFYRVGSTEADAIGLKSKPELGLIKAVFKPERDEGMLLGTPPDLKEGGTGLSGHSNQTFKTVRALDKNPADYITIHLRLGVKPDDARPLFPTSSPVPPPLKRQVTVALDSTEVYLYGTLFALVKEQLDAVNRHAEGKLGFWGKGRIQPRTRTITKFLIRVLQHKQSAHGGDAIQRIADDLDFMVVDRGLWKDVAVEQVEYIRGILRGV
jgi:hypothetical protein